MPKFTTKQFGANTKKQVKGLKVICFDLDETLFKSVTGHSSVGQPYPEFCQVAMASRAHGTYDCRYIYPRPYFTELVRYLKMIRSNYNVQVVMTTLGKKTYVESVLKAFDIDTGLFDLIFARHCWQNTVKLADGSLQVFYQKDLQKVAQFCGQRIGQEISLNEITVFDDTLVVYTQKDKLSPSVVVVSAFNDPHEQRDDVELRNVIAYLKNLVEKGSSKTHFDMFAKAISYTGIVSEPGSLVAESVMSEDESIREDSQEQTYSRYMSTGSEQSVAISQESGKTVNSKDVVFRMKLVWLFLKRYGETLTEGEALVTLSLFDRLYANRDALTGKLKIRHALDLFCCLYLARLHLIDSPYPLNEEFIDHHLNIMRRHLCSSQATKAKLASHNESGNYSRDAYLAALNARCEAIKAEIGMPLMCVDFLTGLDEPASSSESHSIKLAINAYKGHVNAVVAAARSAKRLSDLNAL